MFFFLYSGCSQSLKPKKLSSNAEVLETAAEYNLTPVCALGCTHPESSLRTAHSVTCHVQFSQCDVTCHLKSDRMTETLYIVHRLRLQKSTTFRTIFLPPSSGGKGRLSAREPIQSKTQQFLYRPGQALRFPEDRVSRQSAHEGGNVVAPAVFTPQDTALILISVRG